MPFFTIYDTKQESSSWCKKMCYRLLEQHAAPSEITLEHIRNLASKICEWLCDPRSFPITYKGSKRKPKFKNPRFDFLFTHLDCEDMEQIYQARPDVVSAIYFIMLDKRCRHNLVEALNDECHFVKEPAQQFIYKISCEPIFYDLINECTRDQKYMDGLTAGLSKEMMDRGCENCSKIGMVILHCHLGATSSRNSRQLKKILVTLKPVVERALLYTEHLGVLCPLFSFLLDAMKLSSTCTKEIVHLYCEALVHCFSERPQFLVNHVCGCLGLGNLHKLCLILQICAQKKEDFFHLYSKQVERSIPMYEEIIHDCVVKDNGPRHTWDDPKSDPTYYWCGGESFNFIRLKSIMHVMQRKCLKKSYNFEEALLFQTRNPHIETDELLWNLGKQQTIEEISELNEQADKKYSKKLAEEYTCTDCSSEFRKMKRLGGSAACAYCFTRSSTENPMSKCAQCGLVRYCNAKCQKRHWKKGHKTICKRMKLKCKGTTKKAIRENQI